MEDQGESDSERIDDALGRALSYLSKRDRTESQVRHKLARAGIPGPTVEDVLRRLRELEYVDDERFARTYAEDRRSLDGWGGERIARGLREAGIPEELVASTLDARERDDELSGAIEVLDRKLGAPPADDRDREKALGLLVRRGYELDLAYDAIRAFERNAA